MLFPIKSQPLLLGLWFVFRSFSLSFFLSLSKINYCDLIGLTFRCLTASEWQVGDVNNIQEQEKLESRKW
jgi:hypothetical protein